MSTAKIAIGAGALSLAAAAVWLSRTLLASEKTAAKSANAEAAVRARFPSNEQRNCAALSLQNQRSHFMAHIIPTR